MARVTARQAFTRSQSKRLATKEKKKEQKRETTRALIAAREKYVRQLKEVGIPDKNVLPSMISDETSLRATTGSATKRRGSLKKAAQSNKKITDYYCVSSKGRENFPSMISTPKPTLRRTERLTRSRSPANLGEIEVVTISDDEDDNQQVDIHNQEQVGNRSRANKVVSPFKDLNISVKVDDDIEIVEMLPPIPLRDHPVFDLEADAEVEAKVERTDME